MDIVAAPSSAPSAATASASPTPKAAAERRRLARGVITEDLAAEEQDRIATELRQAKAVASVARDVYARIEDTLTTALSYVTRVQGAYRLGGHPSDASSISASSRNSSSAELTTA